MDIKKIIRQFLLEQDDQNQAPQLTRGQKELLVRLTTKWKEVFPEMTDEDAYSIFLEYRKALPLIKDESQQAVKAFLYRGNGKYTINDLKDGNKVDIRDLLLFLLEFNKFRIGFGGDKVEKDKKEEELKLIFSKNSNKPTEQKIEASKMMWEGDENIVIDEGDFRVYSINSREQSIRMGYYYQEKLRELVLYNNRNNREPSSVSPWCIASRGDDQKIYDETSGRMIINGISNMYKNYRTRSFGGSYYFYFVIDESKDLYGPDGNFYISTIMTQADGNYLLASMYNGERTVQWQELVNKYPKLAPHKDKLIFKQFNASEVDDAVPQTILDRINEIEGSADAFWMQGPDEKTAFINAGGQLKNPKSWETMSNDLREQYINSIEVHDATQKIGSEEFMRAIIKSGISWKNKLDRRMKQIGTSGIGFLADEFMKTNYGPDFYGKKNRSVRIYKNKHTKKYGIYNVDEGSWVTKDGITYDADFVLIKQSTDREIFDDENDKVYDVNLFTSSSGIKFYTLTDFEDIGNNFDVFILSEKKYNELKERIDVQNGQPEMETDTDIGEQEL